MIKITVTKKGLTVIPVEILKKFQIKAKKLIWSSEGSVISVVPAPEDPIRTLRGFSAGAGLRKALLNARIEDEE